MAITTLNLRGLNRSDTATTGQVVTATSAVAMDFQAAGGAWNLIKTLAATGSSISFVDGTSSVVFDGTYNCYCIVYTAVNPSTNNTDFMFNFTSDGGSNYNVTKNQTAYSIYNTEGGGGGLGHTVAFDADNSTSDGKLGESIGGDADENMSGWLYIWNPASTTYTKMYSGHCTMYHAGNHAYQHQVVGYANTTSAIDGMKFLFASGTFDAGSFSLYGLSK